MQNDKNFRPDRIGAYFRIEWLSLALVTVSGLIYNIGLLATPWFEGRLAQCLADILGGSATAAAMAILVLTYVLVTLVVQAARFIKRFYVRRFANNINRRMKGILYANLVRQSRAALEKEGAGELMTKAISDVDDCVEGMRKFTTEIFDTGVALVGYIVMLLVYDWRLALLSLLFTPVSYICAAWMKKPVQREGVACKKAAGALSTATLDRAQNAATYRIYGCETARDAAFKVNALGPRNLALACEKIGARLIHVSTDYVFPGTANGGVALDECAVPAPISAYGQTKLLGEQYVERFCRRHFIVRTAWLYSAYGKNFVKTMVRLGQTHDKITVVNDQLGNPTNAVDLAYHILKLAVSHDYGIYHCTGNGICSWYDFACAIMQGAGLNCKVEPVTSAEYAAANPASANRPAWSALENRMLRCTVGDEMRDWQDALKDFFANWNGEL